MTGRILICVFCGAVYSLLYQQLSILLLPLVVLVWVIAITHWQQASVIRVFVMGFGFGLGFWLVSLYWFFVIVWRDPELPVAIGFLTSLGLVAYFSFYFAALAVFTKVLGRARNMLNLVAMASMAVLLEIIRELLFTGFPWMQPGYLILGIGFDSLLPIVGIHVLNFLFYLLVFGTALVFAKKLPLRNLLIAFSLVFISAAVVSKVLWNQPLPNSSRFLVFHTDYQNAKSSSRLDVVERIARYQRLLSNYPDNLTAILPESSVSSSYQDVKQFIEPQFASLQNRGIRVLFGGYWRDLGVLASSQNVILDSYTGRPVYHKEHLVPFGEYKPKWLSLFGVKSVDHPLKNLSTRSEPISLLEIGPLKLALSICFEVLYGFELATINQGSNVHINVADVSWLPSEFAKRYLLLNAKVRAIESGKPFIYAGNAAYSAVFDGDGGILSAVSGQHLRILDISIAGRSGETPYIGLLNFINRLFLTKS